MTDATTKQLQDFFKEHEDMRIVLVSVVKRWGSRRNPLSYSSGRKIRSYIELVKNAQQFLIGDVSKKCSTKNRATYEQKLLERKIKLSNLTEIQKIKKAFKRQTLIALEPGSENELECCGEAVICDRRKCWDSYKIKF